PDGLHAAPPTRTRRAGLVLGGPGHMPAQGNDGALRGLLFGFVDHLLAVRDGVLVAAPGEADVRPPDSGILARGCRCAARDERGSCAVRRGCTWPEMAQRLLRSVRASGVAFGF